MWFAIVVFVLNSHLLDHTTEDFERLGKLEMMDSSPFNQYNVQTKLAHRQSLWKRSTYVGETVNKMNAQIRDANSAMKGAGTGKLWSHSQIDRRLLYSQRLFSNKKI